MHAVIGDEIVVDSSANDGEKRRGIVVAVLSHAGNEHYRVVWDDGHESFFYPTDSSALVYIVPQPGDVP